MALPAMAPNAAPRLNVLVGRTTRGNRELSTHPSLEPGEYTPSSFRLSEKCELASVKTKPLFITART